jgi:hypothetical protein
VQLNDQIEEVASNRTSLEEVGDITCGSSESLSVDYYASSAHGELPNAPIVSRMSDWS